MDKETNDHTLKITFKMGLVGDAIEYKNPKNKNASKNRDIVAKRLNSNQIEKAQKLARECVRKKYKGC